MRSSPSPLPSRRCNEMTWEYRTNGTGWTCPWCGMFVTFDETHECPYMQSKDYNITVSTGDTEELRLLRQIADSVKKIAREIESIRLRLR